MIITKWQDPYFDLVRDLGVWSGDWACDGLWELVHDLGVWSGDWACDGLWELEKIHMNQGNIFERE